jgi:hypothetical protein
MYVTWIAVTWNLYSVDTVAVVRLQQQFIITIGAGIIQNPDLQQYFADRIDLPSLHLVGSNDFMRTKMEQVQQLFVRSELIVFNGGHTLPRSEHAIQQIVTFLQQQQQQQQQQQPEQQQQPRQGAKL